LVKDLRKMLSLVPEEYFRAKKHCVLSPTFGRGSSLVGGGMAISSSVALWLISRQSLAVVRPFDLFCLFLDHS
jgi:hypothetical protein